jgi:hypothetical protein
MSGTVDTERAVMQRMEARFATARGVADAVLYEGYILYPYHATHGKNRGGVRFQWGVLVPPEWQHVDPSERSLIRTELIVDPGSGPLVAIRLRFLQLQHRSLEVADPEALTGWRATARLEVGGQVWMEWDEAVERQVDLGIIPVLPLARAVRDVAFEYRAVEAVEIVDEPGQPGQAAGRIVRTGQPISGVARVRARWAEGPGVLIKLTVEIENTTAWTPDGATREDTMRRSLIAVHTLAAVDDAAFCSLFDPPEDAAPAVAACQSIGSYPVLVGQPGATDLVLASPIILYDYPAIAPESEGDFHDACEIDEILALRVLTLTDDEKAEARGTDPRARAIIDRCDNMVDASWARMHGTMREIRTMGGDRGLDRSGFEPESWLDPVADAAFDPWTDTVVIRGITISKGSKVRLKPSHRADIHDMFLGGLEATVAGIFHDFDGGYYVAVTVDLDPATEMFEAGGRFFYFHPDEVEPLAAEESGGSSP